MLLDLGLWLRDRCRVLLLAHLGGLRLGLRLVAHLRPGLVGVLGGCVLGRCLVGGGLPGCLFGRRVLRRLLSRRPLGCGSFVRRLLGCRLLGRCSLGRCSLGRCSLGGCSLGGCSLGGCCSLRRPFRSRWGRRFVRTMLLTRGFGCLLLRWLVRRRRRLLLLRGTLSLGAPLLLPVGGRRRGLVLLRVRGVGSVLG
ncbi:hypothetical protein [Mobilicoccus caccae]|uniref:hypothetical protein n=1 Tax=Mobilicoccus caccae TaxID=1859295 RepID=UPI0024E056ED|nr:hypothetical protein [Mobilicoccus caccae]